MAAVQIPNTTTDPLSKGPFQDRSGNLWILSNKANIGPCMWMSSDGGATWGTSYNLGDNGVSQADAIYTSGDVIYVLINTGTVFQIWQFFISGHNWAELYSSGTRPTMTGNGYLTCRSTGEFVVFYQGPTHSLMGTPYRACYYARCSAAGVWSAGVEVSGAVKLHHYDAKGACLGASDRSHFLYTDAYVSNLYHRSLSSANAFGETPGQSITGGSASNFASIYYDSILSKVCIPAIASVWRANSAAGPTWSGDSNYYSGGTNNSEVSACAPALIYEPTAAKLYAFYRDATSDDLYYSFSEDANVAQTTLVNTPTFYGTGGWAQEFTTTKAQTIRSIYLPLVKTGSPPNALTIELRETSPTGTLLGSTTIPAASIGTTQSWLVATFSSSISLANATKYCIVLYTSGGSSSNCYGWGAANTNVYANNDAWVYSGTTWSTNTGIDFGFQIGGAWWGTAAVQDTATAVTGISVGLLWVGASAILWPGVESNQPLGISTRERIAQSFSFGVDTTLKAIWLDLYKVQSPIDNVVVEIQSDSGGSPSGSVVATVATITGSELPTTASGGPVSYACDFALNAGTYWLVVRRSGSIDGTNYYGYAGGSLGVGGTTKYYSSSAWSTTTTGKPDIALLPDISSIGVVFRDSGVYFDKLVLEAPPELIPPTTTNEEFFALL